MVRRYLQEHLWIVAVLAPMVFGVVYISATYLAYFIGPLPATVVMDVLLTVIGVGSVAWLSLMPTRQARTSLWSVSAGCVLVVAFYVSMSLLASAIYDAFGDVLFDVYTQGREEMSLTSQAVTMLVTVLLAPIADEALFRGTMYGSLRRTSLPKFVGAMLSAGAFAFAHGTLVHIIPAFLMGLLCAGIYEYTGKLYLSVLAHVVYNVASYLAAGLIVPDFMGTWLCLLLQVVCWVGITAALFLAADKAERLTNASANAGDQ